MSQNKIPCRKCGKLVRKDLTYCNQCGSLLKEKRSKFFFSFQLFVFFIVVGLVGLIVTFLIVSGFQVTNTVFNIVVLYLFFFFSFTLSFGLIWLAIRHMNFRGKDYADLQIIGIVIGFMLVIAIGVPVFLVYIFLFHII